jgi:hypothetical protein
LIDFCFVLFCWNFLFVKETKRKLKFPMYEWERVNVFGLNFMMHPSKKFALNYVAPQTKPICSLICKPQARTSPEKSSWPVLQSPILLKQIFRHLNAADLCRCSQVCKTWYRVIAKYKNDLWFYCALARWPELARQTIHCPLGDWKMYYK